MDAFLVFAFSFPHSNPRLQSQRGPHSSAASTAHSLWVLGGSSPRWELVIVKEHTQLLHFTPKLQADSSWIHEQKVKKDHLISSTHTPPLISLH